jgi:hypothetical protein
VRLPTAIARCSRAAKPICSAAGLISELVVERRRARSRRAARAADAAAQEPRA